LAKVTMENCYLIKKNERLGIGTPEKHGKFCCGYQKGDMDDEPSEKCKRCKQYEFYWLE